MINLIINAPNALSINSVATQNQTPVMDISYVYLSNGIWSPSPDSSVIFYCGVDDSILYRVNFTNIGSGIIDLEPITNPAISYSLNYTAFGNNGTATIIPNTTTDATITLSLGRGLANNVIFSFPYNLYILSNPSDIYQCEYYLPT